MKTSMPMHTPACKLVDMSTGAGLKLLKSKINTRLSLLEKTQTGETDETVEILCEGLQNEVMRAKYQFHQDALQKEFAKAEELTQEFALTGVYSVEKLKAAMQSLVDVIDETITGCE